MELLNILELEREKQGVSQKTLAKAAGLTQPYYSLCITGQRNGLTLLHFEQMAAFLGLRLSLCLVYKAASTRK